MVSAILLHYVIDDPLPTRGTFNFGDPGADNFFFVFECFSFFLTCLVLFSTWSYYINCFSTWYVWLLLESKDQKKKKKNCQHLDSNLDHQKCRESVKGRQSRSAIKWPTPC